MLHVPTFPSRCPLLLLSSRGLLVSAYPRVFFPTPFGICDFVTLSWRNVRDYCGLILAAPLLSHAMVLRKNPQVDHAAAELESSATSCVLVPPPSSGNVEQKENRSAGGERGDPEHAPGEGSRVNPEKRGSVGPDHRGSSGKRGASSHGPPSDGGSDGEDDEDDDDDDDDGGSGGDDGGSEFEFAFAESAKPVEAFSAATMALTPATIPAEATAADPEEVPNAADGSEYLLSPSTAPATTGREGTPGACAAADEAGRGGGGGGGGGAGAGAGGGTESGAESCRRGRAGKDSSAEVVADPLSRCSDGDGEVDGAGGVGDLAATAGARGRKRSLVVLQEGGDSENEEGSGREAEEEEEEEEEEEKGGNREPAWASLVQSDDEEDGEEEEEEQEEEEHGEGGGGSSGADFAEGGGDSDDDSVWSEEEERRDR